jgi:(E)-4-hydroxy-3-methylbut-2-enyl-diphosphate synthase
MDYRISKPVTIGGFAHVREVKIGGGFPVAIQTMWKDRLSISELDSAAARIEALGKMGCDLLRFAVPDINSAETVGRLAEMVTMPLAADIHFDYKIALRCMDFPIAKIRINPGNIGGREKTHAVLEKAAAGNIPVRIGINSGSLIHSPEKEGWDLAEILVNAAQRELAIFEEFGFTAILVSIKTPGIADTIKGNRILASRTEFPLHLGVTEAGPLTAGVTRNTAALLTLLPEGIGDTIRVSLSDTMENEVIAGREITAAALELAPGNVKLNRPMVNIISCPRCGRYGFDTHSFTNRWISRLYALNKDITVAIMGCEVNGPEEAKNADLGITGAGDKVLIFKHGKVVKTITPDQADSIFEEELYKL